MNDLRNFQYSTLSSPGGQIRLLRVLEDASAEFDCRCEMHDFDIEQAPGYEAISYTWGPMKPTKLISVNDAAFQVRENCWLALCQRRSLNSDLVWIWIDSICINQGDDDEKSEQVQMMADIYRRAARVLLSFPDTDGQAGHLIFSINKAQALAPRSVGESPRRYQSGDFNDIRLWDNWIRYLEGDYRGGLGKAKELKSFIDAILCFASQPYWTRVWVIQELMLAKQKKIMYGKCFIEWEPFMSVVRMAGDLNNVRYGQSSYKLLQRLDKAQLARLDDWFDLSMTNMLYHHTGERKLYSLRDDLMKILRFKCYDLRDRIYGLLRIIDWSPALGTPKVDYRKSRLQLAVEVVELHRSVNSVSFSLESGILRVLELESDYDSKEVQRSLELRRTRVSVRPSSPLGECDCPSAMLPVISCPTSKLMQGIIMSDDTDGLYLDTWEGHRLLLRPTEDKSAYVGRGLSTNSSSDPRLNSSEAIAFFSPNVQVGDKVICPFDSLGIPYMQRGNLVLRSTIAGWSEVVGVGVFNWPQDRVPSYITFTSDLLFDAEDALLLMIVLLGGAHLDDWGEEDLHEAYKRLSGYRCRSRFSSFAAPADVAQRTEGQWNIPAICAECGGKLTGKSRERHCKRYGMPV